MSQNWKTQSLSILFLLTITLLQPISGLECYHCRTNLCNHAFCKEANSLMETSGEGMSSEAWRKIPLCPEIVPGQLKANETEYIETCPKKVTSCRQSTYNLTTTSTKSIVPGNHSVVPVLGSGREIQKSSVLVYGCVVPKYKACSHGYISEYKVPSDELNPTQTEVTDVIVTNTASNCCHCDHDRCNGINRAVECNSEISDVINDPGVSGTSSSKIIHSLTNSIVTTFSFGIWILLTSVTNIL